MTNIIILVLNYSLTTMEGVQELTPEDELDCWGQSSAINPSAFDIASANAVDASVDNSTGRPQPFTPGVSESAFCDTSFLLTHRTK